MLVRPFVDDLIFTAATALEALTMEHGLLVLRPSPALHSPAGLSQDELVEEARRGIHLMTASRPLLMDDSYTVRELSGVLAFVMSSLLAGEHHLVQVVMDNLHHTTVCRRQQAVL